MRKLTILLSCILCTALAKSQPKDLSSIPIVDGIRMYQEVVTLDSISTKENLYRNAKLYFVDNFKSAKDVIQYDDKEQGKIIGKGFFSVTNVKSSFLVVSLVTWNVYYSTEISCKNGKYRYKLYDITIHQDVETGGRHYEADLTLDAAVEGTKKGYYKKPFIDLNQKTLIHFEVAIDILKSYMAKKGSISSKDDF